MSFSRFGMSAPRNTSNADYGRFHFASNMANNQQTQQNGSYSTDGNRMFQHVHYPNCPNRVSPNTFSDGMKDYTIEYGEDAVRAALGGNMPDFQAQFQKQYGGGDSANLGGAEIGLDSKSMQMMNNGQPKVAMIPVVLTNDDGGDGVENQKTNAKDDSADDTNNVEVSSSNACSETNNNNELPGQSNELKSTGSSETQTRQNTLVPTSQENITNAFETVRKTRSTGPVKYGRHVRPSYWKVETPNPCRKKMSCNGGNSGECSNAANASQGENSANSQPPFMESANYTNEMGMNMSDYACFPPPPSIPANIQQHTTKDPRSQSLPPKQTRPTYSLCGKCKKCKNLRSETQEASVLTFPKYSTGTGGYQRQAPHHQTLTSSNLSQSAKNFRAIRFSSHHV